MLTPADVGVIMPRPKQEIGMLFKKLKKYLSKRKARAATVARDNKATYAWWYKVVNLPYKRQIGAGNKHREAWLRSI